MTIPWTEKYRPRDTGGLCGQNVHMVALEKSQHVVLFGPPGTGKSSSVRIYLKNKSRDSVFFFDAKVKSSSMNIIFDKLTTFLKSKTSDDSKYVLVDEVDSFSYDEQKIFLRLLIDTNSKFFFICNQIENVLDQIKQCCTVLHFKALVFGDVIPYLDIIKKNEKIQISSSVLKFVFESFAGDLRKTTSFLQYASAISKRIDKKLFHRFVTLHDGNFIEFIDTWFSSWTNSMDLENIVDDMVRLALPVSHVGEYLIRYHKNKNILTNEYERCIWKCIRDSRTSHDSYFIFMRMLVESPLSKI